MKHSMKKILIASFLAFSPPVMAREYAVDDGNDLLDTCSKSNDFAEGYCLGYVRALSNGVDFIVASKGSHVCYGPNVTIGQVRDVVVDYVRRNPAKRNENALLLTAYAIGAAWPCAKK